ncbi:MAG TPA: Smr/MutS family protein [Gammaproteobacteria bacterium]|nr:Smr/MutS family protein [Gammaproteobacteria bacterium]
MKTLAHPMKRKHTISDEERRLFRETVAGAKPLKVKKKPLPRRPKPLPHARFSDAEKRAVLEESLKFDFQDPDAFTGEELWYARAGVQHALMRKLRRGQFSARAELDLHGLRSEDARHAVAEFLYDARAQNHRCVRIVHGKGLGSGPKGPVIKQKLGNWLRQHKDVLAFCSARPADGGSGALYVLLGKR